MGDVSAVSIPGTYDLVFSRSVFEHVLDPRTAVAKLAGVLVPGGLIAHYMPCRNAPFAILNRWLGNRTARQLLFALFPEKEKDSGFRAYYRDCTPERHSRICQEYGLEVVNLIPYYKSDYTAFLAPLFTLELLRQVLMCYLRLENFAEGFSIVARAPDREAADGAWRLDSAVQAVLDGAPTRSRQSIDESLRVSVSLE